MNKSYTHLPETTVQNRLLIPLTVILLLVVAGFVTALLIQQKNHLDHTSRIALESASIEFNHIIHQQKEMMGLLESTILSRTQLRDYLKAGNRDALIALYKEFFESIKSQHDITHFYFHSTEGVNLLRLHAPGRYDDVIQRYTLQESMLSGKRVSGIELGTLGTFTLRDVQPVLQDGTVVGYLELGREIEGLLKNSHLKEELELVVIINKQLLNQTQWEKGLRILQRKSKWEQYDHYVSIYSSLLPLPVKLNDIFNPSLSADNEKNISMKFDDKSWRVTMKPLRQVSGEQVGKLVYLTDITAVNAGFYKLLATSVSASLLLLFILYVILINILKRTDRKILRQQHELLKSEQRFRALFENTDLISVQGYDSNRRVIYWNRASELVYGYSREQAMGRLLEDLIIPEAMREQVVAGVEAWVQGGMEIPSSELTLCKSDGSPVNVYSSHIMLRNQYDEAEMYCIDVELTELKKTERALKKSEERLDLAMSVANDGIWDWQLDTNQMHFDARYYTMAGYVPNAFPQAFEEWKQRVHPDDIDQVLLMVDQYIKGEVPAYDAEFRFLQENKSYMWLRGRGRIVSREEQGRPLRFVGTHVDISERKEIEDKILHQAHFDNLTDLPNRFLSLDRLSQLIGEAHRNHEKVAVLFLDLDDFKKVNDTLGHETGDKLLVKVAERLSDVARSGDTVGRLGGDEFIILLGGLHDAADARSVVENLIAQFRYSFRIDDRDLILTASIGIAVFPDDGDNPSKLLRNADSAMYYAKEQGRNTYSYFTEAMNRKVSRRLALEEQIHGALDRGEFEVYYQPQVLLSNSQLIGAEALLRWFNPVLGNVSPAEFIPIAEQSGLIISLGQFVLNEALQQTAIWKQSVRQDFRIAVNLSPLQFRDPELVNSIAKALEKFEVAGEYLELEITEGVLMSGRSYIDDALAGLNELGVKIAMDDFGTGYSSLSYLRRYPFDVIKIDKSFVRDITIDKKDRELISAILAFAHKLNLTVVAEGVETQEQLDYLLLEKCDYAQGFLLGKPVTVEELSTIMAKKIESKFFHCA